MLSVNSFCIHYNIVCSVDLRLNIWQYMQRDPLKKHDLKRYVLKCTVAFLPQHQLCAFKQGREKKMMQPLESCVRDYF